MLEEESYPSNEVPRNDSDDSTSYDSNSEDDTGGSDGSKLSSFSSEKESSGASTSTTTSATAATKETTTASCYNYRDGDEYDHTKLCISKTVTTPGGGGGGMSGKNNPSTINLCVAKLDGHICNSCSSSSLNICHKTDGSSYLSTGYKASCSNSKLAPDIANIAFFTCDDGTFHKSNLPYSPPSSHYYSSSSSSSSSYSSSNSYNNNNNNNGYDPVGFIPLIFLAAAIFVRLMRIVGNEPTSRRQQREHFGIEIPAGARLVRVNRGGRVVEMISVPLSEPPTTDATAAVAIEELQDGYATFEHFDSSEGDATSEKIQSCCKTENWDGIKQCLEDVRNHEKHSAEEMTYYHRLVSKYISEEWPKTLDDDTVFSQLLDDWIAAEPENADCRIIRADAYIHWAWHARSAALARHVSQRQFVLMQERLELSAEELEEARKLRPEDPSIYSLGITLAMGMGRRRENIMSTEQCLASLQDISQQPKFYEARLAALQYYCKKWHGSHAQMFAFARSETSDLPVGHPLWVLIPMAHFERNLIERTRGYWKQPAVVSEIKNAYHNAFPGVSETCSSSAMQSSKPYEKRMESTCRNFFAYTLAMCGLHEYARRQIRIIGKRPRDQNPWGTIGYYKRIIQMLGFEVNTHHGDVPEVTAATIV